MEFQDSHSAMWVRSITREMLRPHVFTFSLLLSLGRFLSSFRSASPAMPNVLHTVPAVRTTVSRQSPVLVSRSSALDLKAQSSSEMVCNYCQQRWCSWKLLSAGCRSDKSSIQIPIHVQRMKRGLRRVSSQPVRVGSHIEIIMGA